VKHVGSANQTHTPSIDDQSVPPPLLTQNKQTSGRGALVGPAVKTDGVCTKDAQAFQATGHTSLARMQVLIEK